MYGFRVTAEMTDDQINAQVAEARNILARQAGLADVGLLIGLAQNVVSAQALSLAQFQYRDLLIGLAERGADETEQFIVKVDVLTQHLTRGADDAWSGRRNDSARSTFDAIRAWVSDEIRDLKYERRSGRS